MRCHGFPTLPQADGIASRPHTDTGTSPRSYRPINCHVAGWVSESDRIAARRQLHEDQSP